jgi:hypothetical protein
VFFSPFFPFFLVGERRRLSVEVEVGGSTKSEDNARERLCNSPPVDRVSAAHILAREHNALVGEHGSVRSEVRQGREGVRREGSRGRDAEGGAGA